MRFLCYSNNYNCKFAQANSWHHKQSNSICPLGSGKCGKEGEKLQRF